MIDSHSTLIRKDAEIDICEDILRDVGEYEMLDEGGKTLDQEQEREQQQEQQREVKARRDQEIEVEKFVDQAYRRDNETQQPWHISDLAKLAESEQFYPLSKFKLQHRRPLAFPDRMMVSSNFFNPVEWSSTYQRLHHGVGSCIGYETIGWDIFTSSLNDSQKISLSKLSISSSSILETRTQTDSQDKTLLLWYTERLIRGYYSFNIIFHTFMYVRRISLEKNQTRIQTRL